MGTQNVEQPITIGQSTTMGQQITTGQPQGIAPTVGDAVFCEEMCQDFDAARFANMKI